MLEELSITNNSLDSSSAEIHPGINPFVTGLAIMSTRAVIIPILNKRSTHFLNLMLLIALFSRFFIKRIVLKSTFLTVRRFNI